MTSFHCYDNSDVIATLVITNFHLYLMQLWWQFFQVFVYGDVPRAQTWEVLTLKNSIAPPNTGEGRTSSCGWQRTSGADLAQKCTEIENAAFQHQTIKKDKTSSTTIRLKDEIVEVRVEKWKEGSFNLALCRASLQPKIGTQKDCTGYTPDQHQCLQYGRKGC